MFVCLLVVVLQEFKSVMFYLNDCQSSLNMATILTNVQHLCLGKKFDVQESVGIHLPPFFFSTPKWRSHNQKSKVILTFGPVAYGLYNFLSITFKETWQK